MTVQFILLLTKYNCAERERSVPRAAQQLSHWCRAEWENTRLNFRQVLWTIVMENATCGLKPPSVGKGIEIPGESFGGIPESLVVYGAVSTLAVLLYFIIRKSKCARTCRIGGASPSYFDLLAGWFFSKFWSQYFVQAKKTCG